MVKKRTRTSRRSYKKLYESDEDESDSDLEFDDAPDSPAPKRYGLRQRKRPIFCEDFDYDEEEELNRNRHRSDDEEYNVEVDIVEAKENHVNKTSRSFTRTSPRASTVSISTIEPEVDDTSMGDGLIDFEDVIRADVVVNKHKVDYDSVLNRTEIQVEPVEIIHEEYIKPVKEKGKRGRKPKSRPQFQPILPKPGSYSSEVQNSQEEDTKLEVQIDPLNFVQLETEENECSKTNGVGSKRPGLNDKPSGTPEKNGSPEIKLAPSVVSDIEKYVPPELDEKEKEVVLSNEYLLGNSFDMTADEFLERQAQPVTEVEEEEPNIPIINFDDSDSDDDVVIIEKKPEIIVLDDD